MWPNLNVNQGLNDFEGCEFPGSRIFLLVLIIDSVQKEARVFIDDVKYNHGWLTEYNIHHNYSSPIRVEEFLTDAIRHIEELNKYKTKVEETFIEAFDEYTISEFTEQKLNPLIKELEQIKANAILLKETNEWPRRPLS